MGIDLSAQRSTFLPLRPRGKSHDAGRAGSGFGPCVVGAHHIDLGSTGHTLAGRDGSALLIRRSGWSYIGCRGGDCDSVDCVTGLLSLQQLGPRLRNAESESPGYFLKVGSKSNGLLITPYA